MLEAHRQVKPPIFEAAQTRDELEAEQMAKREAHVADAVGIDIMGFDGKIAAVIEKPIENMNGFAGIGADGNDVERPILVGREPVEFGAGI